MNETVLIALAGFGIAFFHAAIPTHWLPFVITARAQRWNRNKTIAVTALAGTGHVLVTALLGVLIAWFGIAVHEKIGTWFPWIAGGALILFGLFYLYRQMSGSGHTHSHLFGGHSHHGTASHLYTHAYKGISLPSGPHGGQPIEIGEGFVEIAVVAENDTARFRIYPIDSNVALLTSLKEAGITLETVRSSGQRQSFAFQDIDDCLISTETIPKPHQFRAILSIPHGDHVHTHETRFQKAGEKEQQEAIEIVTPRGRISDRVAITSLLALLTFSPCESFLPIYVSGVRYGWMGFALLTVVLSIATVVGMTVFTWLTLSNLEKLNLRFLEKYENGIIGGLLCTLGVLIILLEK